MGPIRNFFLLLLLAVVPSILFAQCAPSGVAGTVNICSPAAGATVTSPVSFQAASTPPSGQSITAMKLYVDGTGVFTSSSASLSTSQTLAAGAHNITIKAWTSGGTVLASKETITVSGSGGGGGGGGCTPTAGAVTICSPANGATVASPVAFSAVSGPPSGQSITAMKLYIDGTGVFTSSTASLNTSQTVAAGTHAITIKAWTSGGTVLASKESITVSGGGGGGGGCTPTANTVTICTPANGATVASPVSVSAVAGAPSGQSVTTMKLYVDNTAVFTSSGASLTTSQSMAAGMHTLVVNAWLSGGTVIKGSATITVSGGTPPPPVSGGVFTYMYNNLRTGANTSETKLTVAAVTNGANFGKKGSWTLDGGIQTQPLYVGGVAIGSGTFNVVYVATENDSVYALNADSPGTVLWKKNLIPSGATIGRGYAGGRTQLGSNIGITGTPVIDATNNRLYVVAKTTEGTAQVYRIHALDLRSGADAVAARVISASVSGTGDGSSGGTLAFDSLTENQRGGLVLQDGILYMVFASYGDNTPYHGWVLAYNAGDLSLIDGYVSTPNTDGGGIWMAGAAPSIDSSGNLYVATGNQMPYSSGFPALPGEIPNSLLKLKLSGSSLALMDYFTPYNTQCLTNDDLDLGSSAPTLIPDALAGHDALVIGSKEGRAYLVDQNNMGKYSSGSDTQILDSKLFNPQGACGSSTFDASSPYRVYGSPAYWNGNVYFGSAFGPLRQYNVSNATLNQVALGTHTYAASGQNGRGPLTIVTANGTSNGIVWTTENDLSGNGWLRAYDATNVSNLIYSSNFGAGSNFVSAMDFNGNVYVSGKATLYIYGLLH